MSFSLVALLSLLELQGAIAARPAGYAGIGDSRDAAIGHAMNKLEMYVLQKRPTSGLTMDELERASAEYKSWSNSARTYLPRKLPLMKLFVNFALIPLENYQVQISSRGVDQRFEAMYLDRLEKAYKTFRPAYLGQVCGDKSFNKSPKIDLAMNAILGTVPGGAPPVTKRMILDAEAEYDSYLKKLEEIETADDIYGNLNEYMHSLNLVNRGNVRALAKSVFPNIDMVETDLQKVREDLLEEMGRRNYAVREGKLIWYGPVDVIE